MSKYRKGYWEALKTITLLIITIIAYTAIFTFYLFHI